jgi:hypothetical protein
MENAFIRIDANAAIIRRGNRSSFHLPRVRIAPKLACIQITVTWNVKSARFIHVALATDWSNHQRLAVNVFQFLMLVKITPLPPLLPLLLELRSDLAVPQIPSLAIGVQNVIPKNKSVTLIIKIIAMMVQSWMGAHVMSMEQQL